MKPELKHKLIDFFSWLALGIALLLVMHFLGPFSLSPMDPGRGPSVGEESRAMIELMCFVAGLSAILIGVAHAFSKEYRGERVLLRVPPVAPFVERRHPRHARFGFVMAIGFLFSLAGLLLWALPIHSAEKQMDPVLTLVLIVGFALMTLITAIGAVLANRRQRLYDRRHRFGHHAAT